MRIKRPERGADHTPHLASRLRRGRTKFYSPSVPPETCYGVTFTFTYITSVSLLVRNLWIAFWLTNYVSYCSMDSCQYADCLRVWRQSFGSRCRRVFIFGHHIHIDIHHIHIDIFCPFHPAFYSKHHSLPMVHSTTPSVPHDRAYMLGDEEVERNWQGLGRNGSCLNWGVWRNWRKPRKSSTSRCLRRDSIWLPPVYKDTDHIQ